VASGIDLIRSEAGRLNLDLDRVVFVGHSAGGHMALWAAARNRLPRSSPLWRPDPVTPDAVVAVAAPGNIEPLRAVADGFCGEGVFDAVVGLPADTRPDVFADTSPHRLLPFGMPVRLIDGSDDEVIPPPLMQIFEAQARAAGDDVALELVPGADHIDVITAGEPGWAAVRKTALSLLGVPVADRVP
jgi:acetyl esterase/lipase